MGSSMSGQDEPNTVLWLATRAGKLEWSCLLGITRFVPQEKFFWSRLIKILFHNLSAGKSFPWQLKISCGLCIDGIGKQETECVNENDNKENKNVDEFHEFVLQQKPAKRKVKRFCLQENENRELSDIPEEELNLLLCKFFKSLKKLDGTEYELGSLTSFQRSLQRSLNERGSNVNIIEGDNFKLSREVLSAKRRQLVVEHGKGNKPLAAHELTEAEEDKLLECGEFGTSNPTILQHTLWWIIALHFGFRAGDESCRLWMNEILVWRYERGSKTCQGQDKPYSVLAFHLTAQATGN